MTGFANRMEVGAAGRAELEAAEERRRAERSLRHDDLLGIEPFRRFLAEVGVRGRYFGRGGDCGPWNAGYCAALRDVVNDVCVHSTKGGAFLAEFARAWASQGATAAAIGAGGPGKLEGTGGDR